MFALKKYIQVSFVLSIPNFLNYDLQKQNYIKDDSNFSIYYEELEECIQKNDIFLNNFTQWYSMIISYCLPSIVLIICYIKILTFMSSKARSLGKVLVKNDKKYKKLSPIKRILLFSTEFLVILLRTKLKLIKIILSNSLTTVVFLFIENVKLPKRSFF